MCNGNEKVWCGLCIKNQRKVFAFGVGLVPLGSSSRELLALFRSAGGDDVGNIRIPVGNEEYERALSIERVSRPFRREYGA